MAWFADWFNSPYYHLLYNHRNEAEAAAFIDNLVAYLAPPPASRMLDLACGKGRHALQLAGKGFEVVGVDLSVESIMAARQHEQPNLAFYTQDMRRPYTAGYFDYVFSFFTSFGYFETRREDVQVFESIAQNLRPGGVFVLDFMNAQKVVRTMQPHGEKTVDDVHFSWKKRYENGFIFKKITFIDNQETQRNEAQHDEAQHDEAQQYEERVRAFSLADIEALLAETGMQRIAVFGDYALGSFEVLWIGQAVGDDSRFERDDRLIVAESQCDLFAKINLHAFILQNVRCG